MMSITLPLAVNFAIIGPPGDRRCRIARNPDFLLPVARCRDGDPAPLSIMELK